MVPDLKSCVSAIRKAEREILRERASKRKMRNTVRRVEQDVGDTGDEQNENDRVQPASGKRKRQNNPRRNNPKRLKGEIQTNEKGRIHFRSRDWRNLTDEEKTFVQTWNAAVKHGESTDDVKRPEGVTIVNKARRVGATKIIDGEAQPDTTTKRKKRITFNLEDPVDDADFE